MRWENGEEETGNDLQIASWCMEQVQFSSYGFARAHVALLRDSPAVSHFSPLRLEFCYVSK